MSRRGSSSSMSSNSDVNFDDLDDRQVFGFLDNDGNIRSLNSGARSRSRSENFCLELSPSVSTLLPSTLPAKSFDPQLDIRSTKPRSPDLAANKSFVRKTQPSSSGSLSLSSLPAKNLNSNSSVSQVATAVISTYDNVDALRFDDAKKSKIRSANAANSDNENDTGIGNAARLVAALTSLEAQVKQLTCEKTQLEVKTITAESTIVNLEQKLTASEQSNVLFARQLENTKESFQAKLMAREEEMSIEILTRAKEKETLFQNQQTRFVTKAELWKREIAALTKVTLDLKSENHQLETHLHDEVRQRKLAETNHGTLATEYASTCEELRYEKEQHVIKIQELWSSIASNAQEHELLQQQLKQQVNNLLLEKEDQLSKRAHKSRDSCYQNERKMSKLFHSIQKIRGSQSLLHMSLIETRKLLHIELQKTQDVLAGIQRQASDFVLHLSNRGITLLAKKERASHLKTQHKSGRQIISHLEETMAKSTRVFEKKHEALKAKYREQNEHLKITLAVRQGLTTDLQAMRKQVADLEREVARLQLANSKTDVKLKHSQQQIIAMQKAYGREVEKLVKGSSIALDGRKTNHVPSQPDSSKEANNEKRIVPQDDMNESEWQEFVELVAAYEAERQLHACCDVATSYY